MTDHGLVVLTRSDSGFGLRFLRALAERGVRPRVLGVEDTPFSKRWRMYRRLAARIGEADAARYQCRFWKPVALRAVSGGRWAALPSFDELGEQIVRARSINDPAIAAAIEQSGARRVVLAQSGIVGSGILGIDGIEVFNAHPALLPDWRGVDVVRWALRASAPIWATLHLVDRGVDTGAVLRTVPVPVLATDAVADVEARATRACHDLLLTAALEGRDAFGPASPQAPGAGRRVYLMPLREGRTLERRWASVRAGYVTPDSAPQQSKNPGERAAHA